MKQFYYIEEKYYRIAGFLFFLGGAIQKGTIYHQYASKLLWSFETGIFVAIACMFLFRKPVVGEAKGFSETIVPLIGGVWPFLLIQTSRGPFGIQYQNEILIVMCLGTGFALLSYLYLNSSFTIMVEARELKSSGPYRYVLHPVYSGQIVTAIAVTAWRFSWINVAICVAFILIQNYRASLEEAKLASAFPEYAGFAQGKKRFFPYIY